MSVITRRRLAILGVFTASFFLLCSQAFAFTIAPSAADGEIDAGGMLEQEYAVFHDSMEPRSYTATPRGIVIGQNGSLSFTDLPRGITATVSENQFTVDPGEIKMIKMSVEAPQTAGVYTIALEIVEDVQSGGNVGVSTSLLSPFFLTVGEIPSDLHLREFNSERKLYSHKPAIFQATFKNSGKRIGQPQGSLIVRNIFGNIVDTAEFNTQGLRTLEGGERTYIVQWGSAAPQGGFLSKLKAEWQDFGIGYFVVELTGQMWENSDEHFSATTSIILLPWRSLVIFFALFGGLLAAGFVLKQRSA